MVTIELTAKCDTCEATEKQKVDYKTATGPIAASFLKRLRTKGWEFRYDQGWRLDSTVCPECGKKR